MIQKKTKNRDIKWKDNLKHNINKDNIEEDNRGGTATISDDMEAGQQDYNNLTLLNAVYELVCGQKYLSNISIVLRFSINNRGAWGEDKCSDMKLLRQ